MGYLYLVRHGESRWNVMNKFTGWVDVPLTARGIREAVTMARELKHHRFDVAFTSHLERAHETILIILSTQHCTGIFMHENGHRGFRYACAIRGNEICIHAHWALNERHYGTLQGMEKNEAAKEYGYTKVLTWRRSFATRPPRGESLKDVYNRVVPYFKRNILPELQQHKNVLIVAHGNTLRALIKYIDHISDKKIAFLELEPAQPLIYEYQDGVLKKTKHAHRFNRPIVWK